VSSIAAAQRLASAAAVFLGRHGDVATRAGQRGVFRQSLYREAYAAHDALADEPGPQRRALRQRLAEQPQRLGERSAQLRHAVVVDADRHAEFAATAQALGVSLSAARALLRVLLRGATPSRPTLGRLAQRDARRAGATLAVLEALSRPRARPVAADEIFAGRRPVLMTVEQGSLCGLGGRHADGRGGAAWARALAQLPALEHVRRDGGQGLRKGLEAVNRERRRAGQAEVADPEDPFHLRPQARRALHEVRHKATRALRKAEQKQRVFERDAWRGLRRSAARSRSAKRHWQLAQAAFDRWSAQERAFERLRAALRLFSPEGELNTRERAEGEVRAALAALTGPEWTHARRRLAQAETFTFLDRAHEQLAALPVPAAAREAVVRAEGLRRQPEVLRGQGRRAAALRGLALVSGGVV
jgi:hypothetical protein